MFKTDNSDFFNLYHNKTLVVWDDVKMLIFHTYIAIRLFVYKLRTNSISHKFVCMCVSTKLNYLLPMSRT